MIFKAMKIKFCADLSIDQFIVSEGLDNSLKISSFKWNKLSSCFWIQRKSCGCIDSSQLFQDYFNLIRSQLLHAKMNVLLKGSRRKHQQIISGSIFHFSNSIDTSSFQLSIPKKFCSWIQKKCVEISFPLENSSRWKHCSMG